MNDSIVWIYNHTLQNKNRPFNQIIAYTVRDLMCKAGVSDTFTGYNNMDSYLAQGETALEIGQKKDPHKWYYRFDEYLTEYVTGRLTSRFSGEQLCSSGVRKLMESDAKNGTDYIKTIRCYVCNTFNASKAAAELYIHRTTFIRRMEKIEEISNIDMNDSKQLFHLILSLQLLTIG